MNDIAVSDDSRIIAITEMWGSGITILAFSNEVVRCKKLLKIKGVHCSKIILLERGSSLIEFICRNKWTCYL